MNDPQVHQWLQTGIDAARTGNKVEARRWLEQVVQHDQYNKSGWFWLAAVVDDLDEKRICLGNVLTTNPENERARRLLEQVEQKMGYQAPLPEEETPSELPTAGTHTPMVYAAVGLSVIAVIVLVAVLVMTLSNQDDNGSPNPAVIPLATSTQSPENGGIALLPTNTRNPAIRPSPLPPTWTPVPSRTPIPAVPPRLYPTAPATLDGTIIMRAGSAVTDPQNHPIMLIQPDGSDLRAVSAPNVRGHAPSLSPDSQQYVFAHLMPGTRDILLEINRSMEGETSPQLLNAWWAGGPVLIELDTPVWSPDGRWIAFTAYSMESATPDLYVVAPGVTPGNPEALYRLTEDAARESWPAFSPGSRFIVYAVGQSPVDPAIGSELYIFNLETLESTRLTTNGSALVESAPDWSPDGQQIVFHAYTKDAPADTDIYIMAADGLSPSRKLIDSDSADIQPRFSPDGDHIVFSSDRSGNWDVFVYTLADGTLYQVTNDPYTNIANDWGP